MKKLIQFSLLSILAAAPLLFASTSEDESTEPQTSAGVFLPAWEAGEFRENFDIRIWPEAVVLWLEQENLRDLIADPETPMAERRELKRILAMQQAWRTS
ncbi:MAG: hypothetical protein P1U68_13690 [Verrucomicrobiales bacterium]|nr:hypothetical protein [Verrucomicrobiales bacterium]